MIDFIASKKVNSKGNLDYFEFNAEIETLNIVWENSQSGIVKSQKILICNQFANCADILDFAESNLIFSSGNVAKTLCARLSPKTPITSDFQEAIAIKYLLNAMIYYNASFDYIVILLRLIFTPYNKLVEDFPPKKIMERMEKLGIDEKNWEIALRSRITNFTNKKYGFNKWYKGAHNIPDNIRHCFDNLKKKNKDLREKYKVNKIKHQCIPHFKRSNIVNCIEMRASISMEQFYGSPKKFQVNFGWQNYLEINEVQEFLISYNNETVKVLKKLQNALVWANRDMRI